MYQIGIREIGECDICPEQEVVLLDKGKRQVMLCKKHLWEALEAKNGQTKPKKGKGKGKAKEQPQEVAEVPVQ